MHQIVVLFACVSTFGRGWRAQRPAAHTKRESNFAREASATSSPKKSRYDPMNLFAMMAFASQPPLELHRFSPRTISSSQNSVAAPRRSDASRNFARMSIDAGEEGENTEMGEDEEEQVVVEVETNSESGEDIDLPSDAESEEVFASDDNINSGDKIKREELKLSLLKMGASYDRGYGASPSARKLMSSMIADLEGLNPTKDAGRGVSGDGLQGTPPLQGNWRMIWTTAFDVLSLASSPVATVGAIHQIIDPPVATNMIDLIPRPQNLLPAPTQPSSILRAEVTTRTSPRRDSPNRVGLDFESVKLKPVEVLGFEVPFLPPLSFDLPRVQIPGSTPETSPGYFDVTYLDDDMLIYRQNDPGGVFVLIRVDSYDP